MKLLIKAAKILSPSSPFHGQVQNIFLEDGIIRNISADLNQEDCKIIDIPGLIVSPGWMDIFANFADPGDEHKENIQSGSLAAATGGFTDVMVIPNTKPAIQDKSVVEYVVQKSRDVICNIHPIGAVTRNCDGKELAEIYDMRNSGAIAFSDGIRSIQSAGLLLKALQYVNAFDGVIIQLPGNHTIAMHGLMNEGIISTKLGLPGKPAIAEELMIARDLELLNYSNSRIHFTGISTQKSHELILKAKEQGLRVSCSVSPMHISFCDEDLQTYDTNLKIDPPLRTRADMEYLKAALRNGEIDCMASHHFPQHDDQKVCEFEYAKDGAIGLETCFAAAINAGVSAEQFVKMQSVNAPGIFGLPRKTIDLDCEATITMFLDEEEYTFEKSDISSKSSNTPFTGKKLKGRPVGIINGSKVFLSKSFKKYG